MQDARAFGGSYVVNVVVEGAPHKGDALLAERDRLGCDWMLYVGDDDNDEDAFALDGNLVGVRIGLKQHTKAGFFLRSQGEIDTLIERLIVDRESSGTRSMTG